MQGSPKGPRRLRLRLDTVLSYVAGACVVAALLPLAVGAELYARRKWRK